MRAEIRDEKEVYILFHTLKKFPYYVDTSNGANLNRLCYIEDRDNNEIKEIIYEL